MARCWFQRPEILDDSRFGGNIERGEWLVEQEDARIGDQGTRQRCTLALATGHFCGAPLAKVIDAELVQHRCCPLAAGARREMIQAILRILLDREMREECEILKDIANASLGDGDVDRTAGIKQDAFADRNSAPVGSHKTGDAIENSRFP